MLSAKIENIFRQGRSTYGTRRIKSALAKQGLTVSRRRIRKLMAIWSRKPERGLIWHTDRGSQYASDSHREILQEHGIEQSMSRKGNCWDNAVSESFFHSLKTELTHHVKFTTREKAKQAIFEYIEVFYNHVRMHSTNDYLSPVEYERAHAAL